MTDRSIDQTAAYWALKLQNGALTELERRLFSRWTEESYEHQSALNQAQTILTMTARAADIVNETHLDAEFSAAKENLPPSVSARRTPLAIAASIALMIGVAVWVWASQPNATLIATEKGEQLEYNLADGSNITLNTASTIGVKLSRRQRRISLDDGEAYFKVAPDANRPFIVSSRDVEIVVVGTTFNVNTISNITTVSVDSGIVNVNLLENNDELFALTAGQQLVYNRNTQRVDVHSFETERVSAWLKGNAIYDGQPLEYVLADLNRYYPGQLLLSDPILKNIPVSGAFDVTDPIAAIDGLTVALSLRQERMGSGDIRLYPADSQSIKPQE